MGPPPRPTLFAVLTLALLSACGPGAASSATSSTSVATVAPATPTPVPPLHAPAIVQVENSPDGRPQSGLAAANLVYESVAEGGVGRFSAFFFGSPPPAQRVGPVRSARTVTVALAAQYQAFLAYSGASIYIQSVLASAPFPSYDEDSAPGNLFRIDTRHAPHNLYTDGQHLDVLASLANRPPVSYRLWPRTAVASASASTPVTASAVPSAVATGTAVSSFTVPVSFSEQPVFTWRPDLGGFTRTEDTGLMVDPGSGAPLVLPTVVVQQVAITTDPRVVDVIGHLGVDHRLTGSGTAQVFTAGRAYAATWTQPDSGPPRFSLADGSPAPIAPGEVWISLVDIGQPAAVR